MIIHLIVAVSELTEVAILAILYPSTRTRVLLAAWNGPVGKLAVAEQRSSKLANRVCMPTGVKSLTGVLALGVFANLDSRIRWFTLG